MLNLSLDLNLDLLQGFCLTTSWEMGEALISKYTSH